MDEIVIEDAEPFDLTPEQEAEVERQLALAEAEEQEVRVNFRWRKSALDTVKLAAEAMGLGYQTYLKQIVYRQAIQDLQAEAQVRGTLRSAGQETGFQMASAGGLDLGRGKTG